MFSRSWESKQHQLNIWDLDGFSPSPVRLRLSSRHCRNSSVIRSTAGTGAALACAALRMWVKHARPCLPALRVVERLEPQACALALSQVRTVGQQCLKRSSCDVQVHEWQNPGRLNVMRKWCPRHGRNAPAATPQAKSVEHALHTCRALYPCRRNDCMWSRKDTCNSLRSSSGGRLSSVEPQVEHLEMEAVLGLAALAHSCLFCQRPLDQHLAERTVHESLCTRTCSRHLQSSWRLEQSRGVAIARIACVRRQAPRAHFFAARISDGIPRAILQHDSRP